MNLATPPVFRVWQGRFFGESVEGERSAADGERSEPAPQATFNLNGLESSPPLPCPICDILLITTRFRIVWKNAMAFIPAPGVAEFVMRYTLSSTNPAVNVYNILHQGGEWTEQELQDTCVLLETWESQEAKLFRSTGCVLGRISARDLTTQFGPILEYDVDPAIQGNLQFPLLPSNVTFCISYRTGRAGRSRRGRHYWIGLAESQVTGNFMDTNQANGIQGALVELNMVRLLAAGQLMVVLSRQENNVPRTTAQAAGINGIFYTDLKVDTQRRRLRLGG